MNNFLNAFFLNAFLNNFLNNFLNALNCSFRPTFVKSLKCLDFLHGGLRDALKAGSKLSLCSGRHTPGANFETADGETMDDWTLLSYQKNQLSAFIYHIRVGVELASREHAGARPTSNPN